MQSEKLRRNAQLTPPVELREPIRNQLAQQVDEYIARGGAITTVEPGVSAEVVTHSDVYMQQIKRANAVRAKAKRERVAAHTPSAKPRKPKPGSWTKADEELLVKLRADGVSYEDITKQLPRTVAALKGRHTLLAGVSRS